MQVEDKNDLPGRRPEKTSPNYIRQPKQHELSIMVFFDMNLDVFSIALRIAGIDFV